MPWKFPMAPTKRTSMSSLINTPQIQINNPVQCSRKSVTFRTGLTGLSAPFLHKEYVTIYSQVVHQPSGIRRFWFGVSRLLSPFRPILRNGNPLLKFLGNAFTGKRILQRPTPRHLWCVYCELRVRLPVHLRVYSTICGRSRLVIWSGNYS